MLIERLLAGDRIPESLLRAGTRRVVRKRLIDERTRSVTARDAFVESLGYGSIAGNRDAANNQHYEQPAEFFELCLGPRLKYSASMWPRRAEEVTLEDAENFTLDLYAKRARIADGQRILDLGCGWGSMTLWLAEHFPNASITSVSDSAPQREFICARAKQRGFENIEVKTADVSEFTPEEPLDRIVSIEMFEHLRNYRALFERLSTWLRNDGLAFVHVFAHREFAYPYEDEGESDWMARRFFTGGIMPSASLLPHFASPQSVSPLNLAESWWENGSHYGATAEAWLENLKKHRDQVVALFEREAGPRASSAKVARTRYAEWKLFFIACAELFGYRGGREWGVAHYLFSNSA